MQNEKELSGKAKRLAQAKKSVYKQAMLAGFVILLTLVLVFASITAWYTNIAHTSGLVFEVASWGFSGQVTVNEDPIQAAPGDSGNVYMSLENNSDNVVDVSVNVSKATMNEEMQKRLYFYVDTPTARGGETMPRAYINNSESYVYTVFGMGNLILSEQINNDARLKWEWVYDVLGYYVKGTMGDDDTMQVEEFLRPIEYDYDEVNTVFSYPDGDNTKAKELESIDGTVTVAEFLTEFSKTDGYAGTIDPAQKRNGWYPVSVDQETGTGVWAYLCNYTEIEMATIWDTQQGEMVALAKQAAEDALKEQTEGETEEGQTETVAVELPKYEARLNISAQKSEVSTTVVSSAADLAEAVNSLQKEDANVDVVVVQLSQDLSVPSMQIPKNKTLVLDLNGNTLTAAGTHLMDAAEGSSVTVYDGTLKMPEGSSKVAAINSTGAEVTLNHIKADDVWRLIAVQDNYGGADSKIRLIGCKVNATECAIHLTGNGEVSERLTQLVVEDSTIHGDYMGIVGSGNLDSCGTDITIINSTVTGKWAGIYHPQKDSILTITGSKIIGNTALALKGGHTVVIDSTITGTGEQGITEPAYSTSGFADTGDGIYLETNYEWAVSAEVYGTSKVSGATGALAVRIYEPADDASVTIYGGTFNSDISAFVANGTIYTTTTTDTGTEWKVEIVQE